MHAFPAPQSEAGSAGHASRRAGLGLAAIASTLLSSCTPELERYYVPDGQDIRSVVTGTWDWTTARQVCGTNAQTISFSIPDATMTITYAEAVDDRPDTVYDVVELTQSYVRGEIRGEARLTDEGVPVVWDLVLLSDSSFCWQRTDWQRDDCTETLARCAD